VTVSPDTTIEQAARAMAAGGIGCLVVTEGDAVVGIVTDRDLVVRGLADRVPPDGRVDAVMTTHVVAVDVDSDVRDVIRTFGHHAVRRLPVVRGRHVVGLVTVDDLLVAMTDEIGLLTRGITAQLLFPHASDEPPRPVAVG
jgi:CBS domain-containing protein